MNFGGLKIKASHPHPLSFVAGTESDGKCRRCSFKLQDEVIFKCLQCKYATHVSCILSGLKWRIRARLYKEPNLRVKLYYPSKVTRPVTK